MKENESLSVLEKTRQQKLKNPDFFIFVIFP